MSKIEGERRNYITFTISRMLIKFSGIFFDYINKSWIVSSHTNSSWILSLYYASESVTGAIINLIGGIISDLYSPKFIIIIADICSAIICLVASLYVEKEYFLGIIVCCNIALEIALSFSSSPRKAIVRLMFVDVNRIAGANSIFTTATEITKIVSPVIAVLLRKKIGMRNSLMICAGSYLLSAIGVIFVYSTNLEKITNTKISIKILFNELKEGLKYLFTDKQILFFVFISAIVNFLLAGYNMIIPYANLYLERFEQDCYAVILSCEAIGGILGAIVAGKLQKEEQLQEISLFGVGLSLICAPIFYLCNFTIAVCMLPYIIFSAFLSIYNINYISYIQTSVKTKYLGRVFSITFVISLLLVPVASFFFAFVNSKGNQNVLFFVGIIISMISVGIFVFRKKL